MSVLKDYQLIFYKAVTAEGITLELTGSCPVLQEIISYTNNPNIILKT